LQRKSDPITNDENPEGSCEKGNFQMEDLICYCFQYTRSDIEKDFNHNGRSLIMEKIASEKKVGGCDCANKNPKGR
jgi:hypothetical protein